MQCPECQFDNREGAMFCIECGTKLEIKCSECSHLNPPASKFCEACGSKLNLLFEQAPQELSFEEKITKIQKYLPKGVTEKILAQKDRIEGERKQVTVMFCDLEGFTRLSDKLGPEDAYTIMDQVYEILIHKVHDYEGTVNEMTGDGIMALFGAPIALEDAPQRAIRSAYAIHREMTRFSDKMKQEKEGIPPLKMRVGIHTGPVVVGTLGNDLRVEFKAVGDTVNLASRIEKIAEPGATCVTDETFKLTEGFFRFEALGEKKIKGKEGAIKTYRVIAPSTRRTKFDVSAERGLTPFVGRERELELLLDGFERTKAGRGQAFSIMAEAGVGKSRLLYEFRKAVANEDVTFLEGKCLSYSRSVAYHPIIDILKSNFDINENDGGIEIREKVARGLKVLSADEASTLPYLLELLSVKNSGIDQIPMSPEARRDRIMSAIRRIVLKGSEIKPLIMAFEDLHWIDKSSEDSVKDLLDSISGANIFLILTYRPEFVHTWGGKSYHSQLTLNRLSNRESLLMVSHLLGTSDIEKNLEELVLEKAEGVPFFIEEFLNSLKELEIIKKSNGGYQLVENIQEMTIPSTIQDVIMARVDALPEVAKELLQTGSVIEREFGFELITRVAGLQEQELLMHLSSLKDVELIYERGVYPQSTYIFRHALTREVVYDLILDNKKKRLHKEIADAIEDVYRDNIAGYYEILAGHYTKSESYEKGAEYLKLASKKAERSGLLSDAIAFGEKRIEFLEILPQEDYVLRQIIDSRTILGLYRIQMWHVFEAKMIIDPIIELTLNSGDARRISQIYSILAIYNYAIEENYPTAFKHFKEALKISQAEKDIVSVFFATLFFGNALAWSAEFDKSAEYTQKALEINIAANSAWGIAAVKGGSSMNCAYFIGKISLSHQTSAAAIKIAEESGDIYSRAIAYTAHGIACYGKGFLKKALTHLLKGADLCESINLISFGPWAHEWLGETYFEMGEYQKSQYHHGNAILVLGRNRLTPSLMNLNKIALTRSKALAKEKDIDLPSAYSYAAENKIKMMDGLIAKYISEILINIDDQHISEAEDWIKKAIETDERYGMMFQLGQDYALYADIMRHKGDQSKAREKLVKAIDVLKECGADGWVEKYEEELPALS
jgi:class 3 adenylate cyclase/tetratricopeptide (TPR) repeat protein